MNNALMALQGYHQCSTKNGAIGLGGEGCLDDSKGPKREGAPERNYYRGGPQVKILFKEPRNFSGAPV